MNYAAQKQELNKTYLLLIVTNITTSTDNNQVFFKIFFNRKDEIVDNFFLKNRGKKQFPEDGLFRMNLILSIRT